MRNCHDLEWPNKRFIWTKHGVHPQQRVRTVELYHYVLHTAHLPCLVSSHSSRQDPP